MGGALSNNHKADIQDNISVKHQINILCRQNKGTLLMIRNKLSTVPSYSDVSSKKTFAQLAAQFIPTVLNRVIRSNVPIDFYIRTVLLLLKTTYIRKMMFEFISWYLFKKWSHNLLWGFDMDWHNVNLSSRAKASPGHIHNTINLFTNVREKRFIPRVGKGL
jgi:hypothetical protein